MDLKVSIFFEWKGKPYYGVFGCVSGAGGSNYDRWQLYIDNFYYGQFCYSQTLDGWRFTSNKGWFEDLSSYFEAYMIGWFGSIGNDEC